jgi:tetratricopeptide (TPR) repeat protein
MFASFTTSALARNMTILVYPFENTGSKEYSWISAGMTKAIITDLTGIEQLSVISDADRKKIIEETKFSLSSLVEKKAMLKVGKLTGANIIFTGSYVITGNEIRINTRVINVKTGKIERSGKLNAALNTFLDLQNRVVLTLLTDAGKVKLPRIAPVRIATSEKRKILKKPKPKLTAYKLYAKGLQIKDANPKEALAYFNKSLDIDPTYTDALMETGFTAGYTLNLFNEAFAYLDKAAKIFKDRHETESSGYAGLMVNMGAVYAKKGQPDRTLEYYLNSQSIRDRLGLQNTASYASLMVNIGDVYAKKNQPDRTLEYYLKSQSIRDRLGLQNTASYASLMNNIGTVYWGKGQPDRALKYYLNSQSIRDRIGVQNTAGYASLLNNIGAVYAEKGQFDRALEYFLKDKTIEDRLGLQNTTGYASLMNNLALLYEKQGNRDMAGRYYRIAYDTYVTSNYSGESRDKALKNARRLGY